MCQPPWDAPAKAGNSLVLAKWQPTPTAGHHEYADSPDDAMLTTLPVGPGDVLLMGSDGLFDNVAEEEIRLEVERLVHAGV